MKTILFQGDSITDVGRSRENDADRGHGYATLTAARLMLDHPGEFSIINRGISGNRIVDLYSRIKIDFINLKPDYLSILIGVNDVWHEVSRQRKVPARVLLADRGNQGCAARYQDLHSRAVRAQRPGH